MSCNTVYGPEYMQARTARLNGWLDCIKVRMVAAGDWSLADEGNLLELSLRMESVVRITVNEAVNKAKAVI